MRDHLVEGAGGEDLSATRGRLAADAGEGPRAPPALHSWRQNEVFGLQASAL